MEYFSTIQKLNSCHGAAGEESSLMRCLQELMAPWADSVEIDTLGNLICRKNGSGPSIMLTARADSSGLVVSHIDADGRVRFGKLGDIKTEMLLHQVFRFSNGTAATVSSDSGSDTPLSLAQCWLDIGAMDSDEASKYVCLGDTAVFGAMPQEAGEFILAPYLSERAACLALMDMLEKAGRISCDLTVVFAAQGALGDRGIRAAVYACRPDICISLDTVPAGQGSVPGKGAVLKIMDDGMISHAEIVESLMEAAEQSGTAYQQLVSSGTRSAGGVLQPLYGGVLTGGISIPCRYRGTAGEMVHRKDIEAAAQWLAAFVKQDLSGLKGDSYGLADQ